MVGHSTQAVVEWVGQPRQTEVGHSRQAVVGWVDSKLLIGQPRLQGQGEVNLNS